jgi:hypothetical protein
MIGTPHMMTGAAIGKIARRPQIALPAAFASHFVLDAIPHLDQHALFGVAGGRVTVGEAWATVVDVFLGVTLVLWAVGRQPGRRTMLWAAFMAIVIDLVDNVPPFSHWFRGWAGTLWLSRFHHGIQIHMTRSQWVIGFGTQIVVFAAALWVVRCWKRSAARISAPSDTARDLTV